MSSAEWTISPDERARQEMLVATGEDAARQLSSPLLKLGLDAAKLDELNRFMASDPEDIDTWRSCYYTIAAIEKVRLKLTNHVDAAKLAKFKLEQAGAR